MKKNKYKKFFKEVVILCAPLMIVIVAIGITWLIMGAGRQLYKHPEMIYNKNWMSTEIKQNVNVDSLLENTNYVSTVVWVRDWQGFAISIEYTNSKSCTQETTELVKKEQYQQALIVQNKVNNLIKK